MKKKSDDTVPEDKSFSAALAAVGLVAFIAVIILLTPVVDFKAFFSSDRNMGGHASIDNYKACEGVTYEGVLDMLSECNVLDLRLDEKTSCSDACSAAEKTCVSAQYNSKNNLELVESCDSVIDPSRYVSVFCTCCEIPE